LWTAGFLPGFLEPGAVVVLLAKPVPRWSLLAGKCLGVLCFVAFQALVFLTGTWLALAIRTGVWDTAYFLCLPILLVHFGVFFSFSAMLAVTTRSTVACVFGSILFWCLSWAMNLGRHATRTITELKEVQQTFGNTVEIGYWILPKPLDFHLLLRNALQAEDFITNLASSGRLIEQGAWSPTLSVLASALCGLVLLSVAAYEFLQAEY
jgi:ABC-type transport system involved in multi-copper enzyme maturation permease subunit